MENLNESLKRIPRNVLLLLLLFYVVLITAYSFTLAINSLSWSDYSFWFNLKYWHIKNTIDYTLKFLMTVPIWWLIFIRLKEKPLWFRLSLHLPLLVIFITGGRWVYYGILDAAGYDHLEQYGQVWDLYIPGLFYILQFGIFHAYEFIRKSQRQQVEQAALREAALQSELAAIKAQLNPHFLYNVFNTISASVPKTQERTREMIAQLSDMFRYQLRAAQTDVVPLREEIAFIRQYLELEKARFGDRLRIRLDVPEEALNHPVPPMILQPLVENSIKHGIAPLVEGGEVHLKVEQRGDQLAFTINDTGVGCQEKQSLFGSGIGLENTRIRLEKMFNASLHLSDNTPRGLSIQFSIS